VGYGLEGALNDATAKRIISETISPRFKQGDFYGGIDAGYRRDDQGDRRRAAAGARRCAQSARRQRRPLRDLLFVGFVLVFVVGGVLRAIFGRFLAAGMVGVAAGVIASMLISSVLVAAIIGFVAFIVSLCSRHAGGPAGRRVVCRGAAVVGGRLRGIFGRRRGCFGGGGASGDW
jgi:uncharacterized protein